MNVITHKVIETAERNLKLVGCRYLILDADGTTASFGKGNFMTTIDDGVIQTLRLA